MATTLQTISESKIKIRYREVYASEGINKKSAVVIPAGPYRGLELDTAGSDLSVTIRADATHGDHVAVYETSDGYSLTIRDVAGDIVADLTSFASQTVVIVLYAEYALGSDTMAEYRAYTYAEYDSAPEKDELVVLGTVEVPASGTIPASAISPDLRTMTWENRPTGSYPWAPLLRNPSFEMGETGATYLHASPYWQASGTPVATTLSPVDTDANTGDKSLELSVPVGSITAQIQQYLQTPVVTGQKLKLQLAKKVLIPANGGTGSATITLDFADKDGAVTSSVYLTFDIESVDASWEDVGGIVAVPTSVRVLRSVTVAVAGTYGSAGSALRLDDVQVWLEPSSAGDWLPEDTRTTAEVATQALLIGPENSYDGNAALVKYTDSGAGILSFTRRDGASAYASQYTTDFPGPLSPKGRLQDVGSNLISAEADIDLPRIHAPVAVVGEYTLMWESVPSGEKGYRKYVSPVGQLVETVNAKYNNTTNLWSKDVNGEEAFRYNMGYLGTSTRMQVAGTNSWADSAWVNPIQTLIVPSISATWLQLPGDGSSYTAAHEHGWLRGSGPVFVAYVPVSPYLKPGDEIVSAEIYVDVNSGGDWIRFEFAEQNHGDGSPGTRVSDDVTTPAPAGFTGVLTITNIDFNSSTNILETNKSYWIEARAGGGLSSASAIYSTKITYRAG